MATINEQLQKIEKLIDENYKKCDELWADIETLNDRIARAGVTGGELAPSALWDERADLMDQVLKLHRRAARLNRRRAALVAQA